MKNAIIIVGLILSNTLNAQDCIVQNQPNWGSDSLSCRQNVSLYSEFLKQKNWADASNSWWGAQKVCPQYKPNLYANGAYIYRKIATEKAKVKSSDLDAYVDTLFIIYDLWVKNFGDCDEIKLKSSGDIMKLTPKTQYDKAYNNFKNVYHSNKSKMSYNDIKLFFYSAIYMFNNQKIDCDMFLTDYQLMSELCDVNIKAGIKTDRFKAVQGFLDQSIGPCASCDKLEEIYSVKIAEDSSNMELIKKVFSMLSAKKCTESSFYLILLDRVLNDPENPPTSADLIIAALADYKRKDYSKAKERFNRALEISEDEEETQKCYTYLYDIAFKKNKHKEAFNIATLMSDNCLANEKKASAIASSASTCGSSPLERSLIYCLALEYAEKSCGNTGASTINAWKGLLLPKKELIMLDVTNGSKHNVPCWNKSVTLRTKD